MRSNLQRELKKLDRTREESYPPESMLRKEFIRSVKEAEEMVKKGKGKTYTYNEFKKKFLGK